MELEKTRRHAYGSDMVSIDLNIDCNIKITGDIHAESYYYGTGNIDDVNMTVTNVTISISDISSSEFLTDEALDFYGDMFSDIAEDGYYDGFDTNEALEEFSESDIDPKKVKDLLKYADFDCSTTVGGGYYNRSYFDGEVDDIEINFGGMDGTCAIKVDDQSVIDYIDKAVHGENFMFTVEYNGDIYDSYEDEDYAINKLKELIRKGIESGELEPEDLDDCYVFAERDYWNGDFDDYRENIYDPTSDSEFYDFYMGEDILDPDEED